MVTLYLCVFIIIIIIIIIVIIIIKKLLSDRIKFFKQFRTILASRNIFLFWEVTLLDWAEI